MEMDALHHSAIDVSDYGRAKAFYVDQLGFRVLGEYCFPSGTRRMDCALGSVRLEIFCSTKTSPRPEGRLCGLRHLAFGVKNLEKAVAELEEKGIQTDGICVDPMAGGRMTFFRDPDGLELELYEQ